MHVRSFSLFCSLFLFLLFLSFVTSQTDLGYLQAFSVFVHDNVNARDSNTRGRMAAGGDITLQSYSVGQALTFQCRRTDLLVGNNLIFSDGEVERGKISYRGTIQLTNVGLGCSSVQTTSELVNFDEIFIQLNQTAYNLYQQPATATATLKDATLTLKGLLKINNFKLTSDTLLQATNIIIDVPVNASTIISVSGAEVQIASLGMKLANTTDVQRILWNLFEAKEVQISNVEVLGSILAPTATINFESGDLVGSIAGQSFQGAGAVEYSPYLPPNSNCTCINCPAIWYLPPYSLFVFDFIEMSQSQDNGRIAAGGDVTLENFSVGNALHLFEFTTNSTIVGGSLTFSSGGIYGGNVIVAQSANLDSVNIVNGQLFENTPIDIDFNQQINSLFFYTKYFSRLISNGQSSLLFSTLTLSSADTGLNIFTLTSEDFNNATNLVIDCPETSWAVINIPDVDATLTSVYMQLTGIRSNRIIFNFYNATTLLIDAVGVEGSILAPNAAVTFSTGNINGNLVCRSLKGAGATNKNLPIPLKPPCPPCLCVGDV